MDVQVRLLTTAGHEALPAAAISLPAGTTVEGLLRYLSGLVGFDVREAALADGAYFLMVNGSFCDVRRSLDRRLEAHDAVAVLPVVVGG